MYPAPLTESRRQELSTRLRPVTLRRNDTVVYVRKVFVTAGRGRDVDWDKSVKDIEGTKGVRVELSGISEEPGRRLP